MESIWRNSVAFREREKLPGDKQVHTVVIGAGITGILTAYFLQKRGMEVVVAAGIGQEKVILAFADKWHRRFIQMLLRQVHGRHRKISKKKVYFHLGGVWHVRRLET